MIKICTRKQTRKLSVKSSTNAKKLKYFLRRRIERNKKGLEVSLCKT